MDGADEARNIRVTAFAPRSFEELRQENVLAAADRIAFRTRQPEQAEQARDRGENAFPKRIGILRLFGRRGGERTKKRKGKARVAAWSVDGEIDRAAEFLDTASILPPVG